MISYFPFLFFGRLVIIGKIIDNHVRFYNGPQINGNRNRKYSCYISVLETNHHRKLKPSNMSRFIPLFKLHIKLETSSIILSESRSVVDSLRPLGLYSPWNSPGQNSRVDNLSLLQGIFPTQLFPNYSKSKGKNCPRFFHCQVVNTV